MALNCIFPAVRPTICPEPITPRLFTVAAFWRGVELKLLTWDASLRLCTRRIGLAMTVVEVDRRFGDV